MQTVQDCDLVIHVPRDGSRGSGPFYVDRAGDYGGNTTEIAVAALASGVIGHGFGLSRDEVEVVGHFEVDHSHRMGHSFSMEVLELMRPTIESAIDRFYERFPAFPDGTTEVALSEMTFRAHRAGFVSDDASISANVTSWELPGAIRDQTVYSAPHDGARTYVEVTARPGKFLLVPPGTADIKPQIHYVAIQKS